MLYNYLIIAWRSLLRNKLTTFVNVAGLITGITATLLISLFILDELKYDQHFKNKDRIYRVTSVSDNTREAYHSAQTVAGLASHLTQQLPELEEVTRIMPAAEGFLFAETKALKEVILYTDAGFMNIFNLTLLAGDKSSCLTSPSSMLISESMATKLFGNNWNELKVVGQTLSLDNRIPLTITGVFEDLPTHTHFASHLFATVPAGHEEWMSDNSTVYTYALVRENVNEKDFLAKVASVSFITDAQRSTERMHPRMQPLTDIHLSSDLRDENAIVGSVNDLYALSFVAVLLLIITVSNFANLYAANSLTRIKEVGIRKAIGALTGQVRSQFFFETFLISFLAVLASVATAALLLPVFKNITGKEIELYSMFDGHVAILLLLLGLAIALIAASYPSLFMSPTRSAEALKGSRNKMHGMGWRKGLLVVQFSISGVMIVLSMVALEQSDLINGKDLGFDKDNTVTLANPYMLGSVDKILSLKTELLATPGVDHISITGFTPSQSRWINQKITYPFRDDQSPLKMNAAWLTVDEDFINAIGITLASGRNFLDAHDSEAILINEMAAVQFGLTKDGRDPLGTPISFVDPADGDQHFTLIGIVRDFNFGSLHEPIRPMIMKLGYHRFELVARISSSIPHQTTLSQMERVWHRHLPAIPFQYSFIKERYDQLHRADTAVSRIFSGFCVVTVILSALGLFSIATYTIASRTKEIGIRKVLGASVSTIVLVVSKDFIVLVAAAQLFALPASSYVAHNWLSSFAYKTEISWVVYVATTLVIFTVAVIALGYQSVTAATANPVKNLRAE